MNKSLEDLREQIDLLDEELLGVLARRFVVVEEVGRFKRENGIAPLDESRWREVLASVCEKGKRLGLDEGFVERVFNLIHEYALRVESSSSS